MTRQTTGYGFRSASLRSPKASATRTHFNSSPEIIRLALLMYVHFPLSLRNVEVLLFERGIDICHETVRFCWNRFGPLLAADLLRNVPSLELAHQASRPRSVN